jgi:hypothetical protein
MQYLLDLETLLIFLSSRKQSGELSTNLKRFPGLAYKGPCRVHIVLVGGKIVSCVVMDNEGRVPIEGDLALGELRKMGQLDWTWTALAQAAVRPVPARRDVVDVSTFVPSRNVPIEMIDRNTLPRKHWQVLLLVDGSRTVAHIVTLLIRSPSKADLQEVVSILNDLQQRGIIVVANK